MDKRRRQVKKYIFDYLNKYVPNFKIVRGKFKCPFYHLHSNKNEELTANIFPKDSYKVYCFVPNCSGHGDIVDLYRKQQLDNCEDISDSEIIDMIIDEFKIKINDELDTLFAKYQKWGWDLVRVSKDIGEESGFGKASWIEEEWQMKVHKSIFEWEQWVDSGNNFGVKTNKSSNCIGIDFDFVERKLKKKIYGGKFTQEDITEAQRQWDEGLAKIKEKLPFLDWSTVQQHTRGGIHLFYLYDEEIPKTCFDYEGIHIDIEADGGQIVIEPSIVGGQNRQIIGEEIIPLPKEVKEFILTNYKKKKEPEIVEDNPDSDTIAEKIKGLDGCCNTIFTSVLGEFRKFMPIKSVERTAHIINKKMLDDPMSNKTINAMVRQIEKYYVADINELSNRIIEHFQVVKGHLDEVSFRDLQQVLNADITDIHKALSYLIENEKIYSITRNRFKLIDDGEWRTDFLSLCKPLEYKIPYFNDYARFNNGTLIVIGAKTGGGKTHLTANFIEGFYKQGIISKVISTEADSALGEIVAARGMKEGDFVFRQTSDPLGVRFRKNEVRILDWLKAPNSEFWKLDTIYETLNNKLVDNGGILIVLSQLKDSDETFYSEGMVKQYASLAAKLRFPEKHGVIDNLHPVLETCKIRRPKIGRQQVQIPLEFIPETKELRIKK